MIYSRELLTENVTFRTKVSFPVMGVLFLLVKFRCSHYILIFVLAKNMGGGGNGLTITFQKYFNKYGKRMCPSGQ